jgi:VIT1/CCC1 family predicted Fe2+/Mn2+ transporter
VADDESATSDDETTLSQMPSEASEGAVPPGYDWPTHGGYLGCLLSLMASCLIGGFLGSTLFAALSYWRIVPAAVSIVLTIAVYAAVFIGLGRLGWILGKRFYREYPQPRLTASHQAESRLSATAEEGTGDAPESAS